MTEQLELHNISIPLIVPSRWQPRQSFDAEALLELAKHIRDHGLMYPVILFVNEDGEYELVAGERRTRAIAALALTRADPWVNEHGNGLRKAIGHIAEHGWVQLADDLGQAPNATIAARIESNSDHRRLHELAVADNIQRRNLSPIEEACALQGLMTEHGLSQRDVARQIGWSQAKVQERLSLLRMAPEVQEALTTRVVGTSHARHIARCPQEIQPAVTKYVGDLMNVEGDQATTVRKIAALTQQVRRFLKPERWIVPADDVVRPSMRNRYRLMHHLLQTIDLSEQGEAIMALRNVGSWQHDENLLGKKPGSLNDSGLSKVVQALTGQSLNETWDQVAVAQGWTCENCQFRNLNAPRESAFGWYCKRLQPQDAVRGQADALPDEEVITCLNDFISSNDPFIIPAGRNFAYWIHELAFDGLVEEPFSHFTNHAAWIQAVEAATEAQRGAEKTEEKVRQNKHIVDLSEYWRQQQEGHFAGVAHFQAHLCDRCIHYCEELLEQNLPPCAFTVEPLMEKWIDGRTKAPDFGVLVRQDGLMVPRCVHFHISIIQVAPTPGFRLPDRDSVLKWIHGITVRPNRSTHNDTLAGPLAWLPYHRPKRETIHDLDNLLRYLKHAWDDLGDESMATLITVLVSEIKAMCQYRPPLVLVTPTTLIIEQWASVAWRRVINGKAFSDYYRDWPDGWPKPWLEV